MPCPGEHEGWQDGHADFTAHVHPGDANQLRPGWSPYVVTVLRERAGEMERGATCRAQDEPVAHALLPTAGFVGSGAFQGRQGQEGSGQKLYLIPRA